MHADLPVPAPANWPRQPHSTIPRPTARTLARRHIAAWQLIERALSAEQFSDDGRAAVQRLNEQVHRFAVSHASGGVPAVLIESTLQLIADMGGIAIHIGHQQFAMLGSQRDAAHRAIDGNDSGDGHGGGSSDCDSVADCPSCGGTT